jgi:hyperosmotically inducible protein
MILLPLTLPGQAGSKATSGRQDHLDPYTPGASDESDLIQKIRHNLLMLPYYGVFDDLGFNVNGGTVTLVGQVTRATLKSDAESSVRKLAGITKLVNNIEVLPLSPDDDRIRIAVYRAIYGDPSLSSRYAYRAAPSIHIIVKNGNVRLEGVVDSEMDKNIAGIRAKEVPGAFDVENDLKQDGK